ncbi:MAG: amidohydrolase family protein [Bilophila wadsworthia]
MPACVPAERLPPLQPVPRSEKDAGLEQQFPDEGVARRRTARRGLAVPGNGRRGRDAGRDDGRQSPDMGNVSNDDLMDVVREQPSRFVGIAGVDGSDPIAAIAEIERTVANGNLRGAGMEPGCGAIPMYVDDARLYPIYQYCSDRSIPMFLMGGGGNGPDLSYSNPEHIDRVCRDFPKLAVVNMHGSYPWVPQVLFSCMCRPNMYLAPDMYMYNMPGAADYVTAANGFLRDRFLFGSGYPYIPLKQAVDLFVAMPFDRSILPNLLYKNMARVLATWIDCLFAGKEVDGFPRAPGSPRARRAWAQNPSGLDGSFPIPFCQPSEASHVHVPPAPFASPSG